MKQQHLQLAATGGAPAASVAPPFGVVEGESPLLAAAELAVATEALQFLRDAIDGRGSGGPAVDAFETAVRSHFTSGLPQGMWMDAAWMKTVSRNRTPADFALIAWQSFATSHLAWSKRLGLTGHILAFGRQVDDADLVGAVTSAGGLVIQPVDRQLKGLALAWDTAQRNVERSEFRYAAAFTLAGAAKGRTDSLTATADAQFDALSAALWSERQAALVQLFAVGSLVGAAAAPLMKARAKDMFGEGKGVMQLLEVDGRMPGRFLEAEERRLRGEIAKA